MLIRMLEALVVVAIATLLVISAVELWEGPAAAVHGNAFATTPSGAVASE